MQTRTRLYFASIRVRGGRTVRFERLKSADAFTGGDLLELQDYRVKEDFAFSGVEQEVARLFSETRPIRPFVFETSMLNNFGLKALSTFLHVPFCV